ncbi:hypothetical protein JCM8547_003001 [Rhodosporidiobolus lusitaniae]
MSYYAPEYPPQRPPLAYYPSSSSYPLVRPAPPPPRPRKSPPPPPPTVISLDLSTAATARENGDKQGSSSFHPTSAAQQRAQEYELQHHDARRRHRPSGWVGSHVVPELLSHGYTVHVGELDDVESLKEAAKKADGVIHLAFKHDFKNYQANGDLDARIVEAIASTLEGTDKPFVITSEHEPINPVLHNIPRVKSERILASFSDKGVRTAVVRLPPTVHGNGDHNFITALIAAARRNCVSPFEADEEKQPTFWSGVHVEDAAVVFRLAPEEAPTGSILHAVGDDDGLSFFDLASTIGRKLDVSVKQVGDDEVQAHFGQLKMFATLNVRVSNVKTKEVLGWQPSKPTLKHDLEAGFYFH